MATLDHAHGALHAEIRTPLPQRLVAAVSKFIRAWRNRRAFYRLGEMNDSELADIGLTRADLHVAVVSGGDDPTTHLGAIAQARIIEDMARRT